jgi:GT2 family glycosyltransferase
MSDTTSDRPLISVVLPTYERAPLLERSLESLTTQTLSRSQFEVIVVDDGSSEATASVCTRLAEKLPLRYFRIENSGTSAAKNLGLFASHARLVLFFDDDDLADPRMLEAHVEAHRTHPEENVAVLGYTTWAPELEITPLMEYVTEIGHLLFSYRTFEDGQRLDYTHFWAGRISCKRAFLAQRGIFDQGFRAAGIEDIELGFRLAKHGLSVIHARGARSFMLRSVTFDEFARRCVTRGRALWLFNSHHSDPSVERYCRVVEALDKWPSLEPSLEEKMERIRELERQHSEGDGLDENALGDLREHYRWTFDALQVQGIAEAEAEASKPAPRHQHEIATRETVMPTVCPDPVFIIGSPRSGTTVLANSLGEHSELWTGGESYFLFFLFDNDHVGRAFDRAMEIPGPRWLRVEDISRNEFLSYIGLGINAMITDHSEGRRWIDHTPLYTLVADTLAKAFPGARFIHILRDGRDVVHSMLHFADSHPDPEVARFAKRTIPWATDIGGACEFWRDHVEAGMDFCDENADRAMVVRYEDLVAAPEATFHSIHRFLAIADESAPARFLASRRINSSFDGRRRLSGGEIGEQWREEQRRTFAEVAGPTMLRCGYLTTDELGLLARANPVAGAPSG